jgi:hypothetical protein
MSKSAHFVTFYSPGTFFAESTTKPIQSWDVAAAVKMAHDIKERYGATPYGFQFSTRARDDDQLDSKERARSPFYYLGGRIETIEEIEKRADPKEGILLSNMKTNGWSRVFVNNNSWRWTQPLNDTDVVLEFTP